MRTDFRQTGILRDLWKLCLENLFLPLLIEVMISLLSQLVETVLQKDSPLLEIDSISIGIDMDRIAPDKAPL